MVEQQDAHTELPCKRRAEQARGAGADDDRVEPRRHAQGRARVTTGPADKTRRPRRVIPST
jgi:hypothetical protein